MILPFLFITTIAASAQAADLTEAQAIEIIKLVDERQRNSGDYKSLALVKEKLRNKEPRVFQAMVYRRDKDDKFMILFTKPKEEAGKAYLKIDKNLWNYDPGTGKWERRTEREKLAGTNSRRSDFDESRLAEEYTAKYEGGDKLGDFNVYKFRLTSKPGIDVAYPMIVLWVDQAEKNVLKREEYALSGKLMRRSLYPKWEPKYSESKKANVFVPRFIHIYDELEKGNSTDVEITETDLKPLEENIFTKAWIESKSK